MPGDKRLIAYLVAKSGHELPGSGELRGYLSRTLPDHMIPVMFVRLEALPLTPNGKLDRKALPAPDGRRDQTLVYRAPGGPQEEPAGLIGELLGIDRVGADDNFFELGGDSIRSIQLVSRARDKGIEISPRQVFEQQTVAGLASVARLITEQLDELAAASGSVALTPIQHWFFDQPGPVHHFNQAVLSADSARFRLRPVRSRPWPYFGASRYAAPQCGRTNLSGGRRSFEVKR